jgi:hypothetical protein
VVKSPFSLRFEVLTAVAMLTVVFWVVAPYSPVGGYQRVGGMLIITYKTTWRHNPEDHNRNSSIVS